MTSPSPHGDPEMWLQFHYPWFWRQCGRRKHAFYERFSKWCNLKTPVSSIAEVASTLYRRRSSVMLQQLSPALLLHTLSGYDKLKPCDSKLAACGAYAQTANSGTEWFVKTLTTWEADVGNVEPQESHVVWSELYIPHQWPHPRLVRLTDFVHVSSVTPALAHGYAALVYPRADQHLLEYLRTQGANLSFRTVRALALELVTALQHLHVHQIIHCDVKPENILIHNRQGPHLRLADFGLSVRHVTQRRFTSHTVTGLYRAPELLTARDALSSFDKHIDHWALGMTLWDMVSEVSLLRKAGVRHISDAQHGIQCVSFLEDYLGPVTQPFRQAWGIPQAYAPTLFQTQLVDLMREQLRNTAWPEWFVTGWANIVTELLRWNPHERAPLSTILQQLGQLQSPYSSRVQKPTTAKHRRTSQSTGALIDLRRRQRQSDHKHPVEVYRYARSGVSGGLSAVELGWRRVAYPRATVTGWWDTYESHLIRITRLIHTVLPQEEVFASKDRAMYLDLLVLCMELQLQVHYRCPDSLPMSLTELELGCLHLAVQLTRPHWPLARIYALQPDYSTSYLQQLELFVVYTLEFSLYRDNMLTQMVHHHNRHEWHFEYIKTLYLGTNSECAATQQQQEII